MTEVNIFPYKLSLSLNISDFIYVKIATPLKKITPLFPSKLPLKVEVLSSPPPAPFENLVGGSTPLPAEMGGMYTMKLMHEYVNDVFLVFLLLASHIFHTFF